MTRAPHCAVGESHFDYRCDTSNGQYLLEAKRGKSQLDHWNYPPSGVGRPDARNTDECHQKLSEACATKISRSENLLLNFNGAAKTLKQTCYFRLICLPIRRYQRVSRCHEDSVSGSVPTKNPPTPTNPRIGGSVIPKPQNANPRYSAASAA